MLWILVFLIGFLGCSRNDDGGSTTSMSNGGKGSQALVDGTYLLQSASYNDGSSTLNYSLVNNSLQYKISWLSTLSVYQVELTGKVTYQFTGGSADSGCSQGTRVSQFKLDDTNNITGDTKISDCITAETSTGSVIKTVSDSLTKISIGVVRTTKVLVDDKPYTYTYTFGPSTSTTTSPTPTSTPTTTTTTATSQLIPDGSYKLSAAVKTTSTASTDFEPTGNTYRYVTSYDSSTDYYNLEVTGAGTFPSTLWGTGILTSFGCVTGSVKYKFRFSDSRSGGSLANFSTAQATCTTTSPQIDPDLSSKIYLSGTTLRLSKTSGGTTYEFSFKKE